MELLMMLCQVIGFFLLFLCHSLVNSSTIISYNSSSPRYICDPKESFALLEFKNSFSLDGTRTYLWDEFSGQLCYPKTRTWNESKDCCSWDGVECDEDGAGHVIALDVSCSLLRGTIHLNSSLFILSHLQRLNLAYNDFNFSPVSTQFGRLQNLRFLNLSASLFQGDIPLEISQLSKLISLDLSQNYQLRISNLVLNMLVHNLTNLRDLALNYVNLSNVRPIPLRNLSLSIVSLRLHHCELTGNFPNHVFGLPNLIVLQVSNNYELSGRLLKSNWSKSLEILDLRETNFSGDINTIVKVKSLKYLDLSGCNWNGPIPESIGNLTQIATLSLSSNEFNGKIPSTISNLDQLVWFDVSDNLLTGLIPDIWTNLQKLTRLGLSENSFIGQLPNSIFNLTQLSFLDASFNMLSGPLPTDIPIGGLSNLVRLSLSYNSLNNTIPPWLYALPRLVDLSLSNNQFIGVIRDFKYNSLQALDLGTNNLQGGIPESIYRQLNLTILGLGSNNLSGILNLDMLLRIKTLGMLDLSNSSQLLIYSNNQANYSSSNLHSISLASCNLIEFPYFLRNLKHLKYLNLSHNQIKKKLPDWFSELGELQKLDLSHNLLSTGIEMLTPLTNLLSIFLDFNLFKVPIAMPPSSVIIFSASNNKFNGHILPSICQAANLTILNLSNNRLSGTIPPCVVNMTFLLVLDLKLNSFSGIIPTIFGTWNQLQNLGLNGNQIEGELPQSLLHCENLEILDVGNNKISGTFPYWLEGLSSLRVLILRSNRFYGPINNSMTIDSFPRLQIIDLSHNHFSGLLPTELFQNLKAMKVENETQLLNFSRRASFYYEDSVVLTIKGNDFRFVKLDLYIFTAIDFSNNNFSGEIPIQIGMLTSLKVLNLSHDNLTGQISPSFGKLINLETLDLSSNKLIGEIPYQLAVGLTFLSYLNLSQNHLSGPIPEGKQFDTFDNTSYIGNSELCGLPLSRKCNEKRSAPVEVEVESSFKDEAWQKAAVLGYGCGVVCGILVGYIVFETGRPAWVVAIVERKQGRKMQRSRRNAGKISERRRNE